MQQIMPLISSRIIILKLIRPYTQFLKYCHIKQKVLLVSYYYTNFLLLTLLSHYSALIFL